MFVIGLVPNSVDPSAKLVIFSLFCFFCSLFFQSHKLHIIHSFYDGFFCSMLASKRYLKLSTIKKEHITTIDFPSLTNKCAFVLAILKRNSRMHVGEINTVLLRQFQLLSLFLCPDKNGMFFFSFCCTMSSDKCWQSARLQYKHTIFCVFLSPNKMDFLEKWTMRPLTSSRCRSWWTQKRENKWRKTETENENDDDGTEEKKAQRKIVHFPSFTDRSK